MKEFQKRNYNIFLICLLIEKYFPLSFEKIAIAHVAKLKSLEIKILKNINKKNYSEVLFFAFRRNCSKLLDNNNFFNSILKILPLSSHKGIYKFRFKKNANWSKILNEGMNL